MLLFSSIHNKCRGKPGTGFKEYRRLFWDVVMNHFFTQRMLGNELCRLLPARFLMASKIHVACEDDRDDAATVNYAANLFAICCLQFAKLLCPKK